MSLSTSSISLTSAKNPWKTIVVWIVVLVGAMMLAATTLGDVLTTEFAFTNTPEAQRGVDLIEELRGEELSTNEIVIVQSDTLTTDDAEFNKKWRNSGRKSRLLGPTFFV